MTWRDTVAIGSTDIAVTRLSLGTAALGGLFEPVADSEAAAVMRAALDAGVRYVDTAPLYGYGTSERRLGKVLASADRSGITVSTKAGRNLSPGAPQGGLFPLDSDVSDRYDYSLDAITACITSSLERLGVDHLDIVYLHDPDAHLDKALDSGYRALDALRAEGVIRAIGVGSKSVETLLTSVRSRAFDCILVAGRYTLLDQSALTELLPACAERSVSVVVGGVYNSGILADPSPKSHYEYGKVPENVLRRARRISEVCEDNGVPHKAAALQYPLRHPAVASVLAGPRSLVEWRENLELMEYEIPDVLWSDLAARDLIPKPDDLKLTPSTPS